MSKITSKHKNIWFVKVRGSYLPCSWQGWATYVPFTLFLFGVFQAAIRNADAPADAFYAVFPQFVCAGIVMTWVASRRSN